MRKLLTVLAAAVVALSVTAGTAIAQETPDPTPPACTVDHNPRVDGCQNSGPIWGGPRHGQPGIHHGSPWYPGLPGNFPRLINNTYLPVNLLGLVGVGNVDVCTYADWGAFDRFGVRHWANRWGGVRGHFGPNPAATWLALRQAASCGSTVVVQAGLPNLVNGSYLNLGSYGLTGNVSVCQYPTFDAFSRVYRSRFGNHWGAFSGRFGHDLRGWNAGWNHLRLQASCAPSVVVAPSSTTIVQQAPTTTVEAAPAVTAPAPAADPTPVVDPAPAVSNPQVSTVPKGSADTGDGSTNIG
jgi:hypothetical protein